MERETLATFPYVVVRIACRNCNRCGSYRLARLAERYGADTTLEAFLIRITADCYLASNRTGRPGCRAAYFPDLDWPQVAQQSPERSLAEERHRNGRCVNCND